MFPRPGWGQEHLSHGEPDPDTALPLTWATGCGQSGQVPEGPCRCVPWPCSVPAGVPWPCCAPAGVPWPLSVPALDSAGWLSSCLGCSWPLCPTLAGGSGRKGAKFPPLQAGKGNSRWQDGCWLLGVIPQPAVTQQWPSCWPAVPTVQGWPGWVLSWLLGTAADFSGKAKASRLWGVTPC